MPCGGYLITMILRGWNDERNTILPIHCRGRVFLLCVFMRSRKSRKYHKGNPYDVDNNGIHSVRMASFVKGR